MQCNDPTFDYACNVWYPNINKKLKIRLKAAQNKSIRFCLTLNERSSINSKDFEKINRLPIHERVSQCSRCSVYKFFTKYCPNYFDEIYVPLEINGVHTRSLCQKLNVSHRKTNFGQKAFFNVDLLLWNNLSKMFKTSTSINAFKHNIKQHHFNKLKKKES